MVKNCFDCMMKGFDMKIAYIICFGIILFCLSVVPSNSEGFIGNTIRTHYNRRRRVIRQARRHYRRKVENYLNRLRRKYL